MLSSKWMAWSGFTIDRAKGSHLLPHRTIGDYRTIGRYRAVTSDLWRPSPIVR